MPALAHVDLVVEGYDLTTTPGTVIGTSGALTSGRTYLVLASGYCCVDAGTTAGYSNLEVGGTVYARQAGNAIFAPGTSVAGYGAVAPMGSAFTYTPAGGSDTLEIDGYGDGAAAAAEATFRVYALDVTDIADRWHREGANDDTIVTTPASAAGWVLLDTALTETLDAGDYLLIASVEAVPQSGVSATDEIAIRTVVDGSEVPGSAWEADVMTSPTDEILGYLFARRITIGSTGSHAFQIEGNGTLSNGNVGFRRVRLHVIAVSAFEDSDVGQILDTDGETASGTGTQQWSAAALNVSPSSAGDYLFFAHQQKQATFWGESFILRDPAGTPVQVAGFGTGVDQTGTAASGDQVCEFGLWLENVAASTDYTVRIQKFGGGGNNVYGAASARTSAGDMTLLAIRLATPAAGGTTHELAGTLTGEASATADLEIVGPTLELAATVTGEASTTANATLVADLTADAIGEATATADLERVAEFAGSLTGEASTTADLERGAELAATVTGEATATGALALDLAFAATITGEGLQTATLEIVGTLELAASATGQASASADLSVVGPVELAGAVTGQASTTADLQVPRTYELAASITGAASLSGSLSVAATVPFPRPARTVVPTVAGRRNRVVKGHV